MITADDISELRKAGRTDDEILQDYREFDPQYNEDIDFLQKSGRTSKDILDDLSAFNTNSKPQEASKPPQPKSMGFFEGTKGALQYGSANALKGIGSTLKHAGFPNAAQSLDNASKTVAPSADYTPAGAKFDITDPSTYGYAPRALAEGIPGVAADLTAGAAGGVLGPAGAVGGFMASNAARNLGANVDARMEYQGKTGDQASASDYVAAGASTAAEAALSRIGLGPAISGVTKGAGMAALKQIPGQVAKAGAVDAAAGAAGDLVNQVGRTAGTDQGLSIDPKELANNAGLSGMTGGAIRAARAGGDVTNAIKFRGIDEDAGARLVERLDRHGGNTKTDSKAFETVNVAKKTLDTEITDATQVIRPLLKSQGNNTETDALRVLVKDTTTTLRAGAEAPEGSISSLRERLGGTAEGERLVKLLEERQALNRLMKSGNFDEKDGTFAGGISGSDFGKNIVDPRAILRGKVGPALPGIAGLGVGAQLGALAPTVATAIGAQAGAYGASRVFDNALGLRDPAGEFMQRFRGKPMVDAEGLPSFRQDAADTQAASKVPDPIKLAKAKAKQEDRAWKQQETADKQAEQAEARRRADEDKAWATQDDPRLRSKDQQEDALWAQREKEATQAANEDLTASEGIREGYSSILERTVKEALASKAAREKLEATKAKDTDKAYTAKQKADAEEAKRQAETERAWAQQNKQPPQLSEDAMWKDREPSPQPTDWSDMDAISAIQSEIKSREKLNAALRKAPKKQPTVDNIGDTFDFPANDAEPLKVRVRSGRGQAQQQQQQQPQAQATQAPEVNPDTIRITHGDQTVERPREGIRNEAAYVTKTKHRMADRQVIADEMLSRVGERQKPHVDAMLGKLNNSAKSFEDAYYIVEDAINTLPEKAQGELWDIWNKHEGRLKATYDK